MFISTLALLSAVTFSSNRTPPVQKIELTSTNSVFYAGVTQNIFVYSYYNNEEDATMTFTLTYDGNTYDFVKLDYTSFSNYGHLYVTSLMESNLCYQIFIAEADEEGDYYHKFASPEFMTYDEEPVFHKYYGSSSTTLDFNIQFPDGEGFNYYGVCFGLKIWALDESTYDSLSPTYSENYNNGYNDGYNQGKSDGYTEGYNEGNYNGDSVGYQRGYTHGYNDAFNTDSTAATIFTGIVNVALVPINFFLACLNFEVFGINIGGFVSALLTVCIIIIIVRMITGKKSSGE